MIDFCLDSPLGVGCIIQLVLAGTKNDNKWSK